MIEVLGGGKIATQIVLGEHHTLLFGPGHWTNSTPAQTILLHDHTVLAGHGWDTIIDEAPSDSELSYSIVEPYAMAQDGPWVQVSDISVHDIQFSGAGVSKPHNASASTVISGLLDGGSFTNLLFNKTHSIGLSIGGINSKHYVGARNVTVQGNKFVNVGGGTPPDFTGGGGVSFAIIQGDHVTIMGNTFIDALGNDFVDIEPNTGDDDVTNIVISNNTFRQDKSTGIAEPYTYGITTHTAGGKFGPITISNNVFHGAPVMYPPGSGVWQPDIYFFCAIYVNYGSVRGGDNVTVSHNDIQFVIGQPIVLDNSNNDVVDSNHIFMPNGDIIIVGSHNLVENNYISAAASQDDHFFGIEERNPQVSDFNEFLDNQLASGTVVLIGPHSISRGNTPVSRPRFP